MASMEIVKDMRVGWNPGNTLDSWDDRESGESGHAVETSRDNPETTKELYGS